MTGPETGLPLEGIRVLDFGHTVMGPACGLILADLGADVIKVEPAPGGDPTRRLAGFGSGYFGFFNRNKRSLSVDLKTAEGREVVLRLLRDSDVLIENFAPGTMDRLGLSADTLKEVNPELIYASLKGFLDGPYRDRLALDEVVQMMGGLAYMTGPSGRPLRAGTSVIDITGGMFAVIGILSRLLQRQAGKGAGPVQSALFETTVFLMGQHLCYASQGDAPIPPMPERVSAWAVYDLVTLSDDSPLFVGITTDSHWQRFCEVFARPDLLADAGLATNNQRVAARDRLLPEVRAIFAGLDPATAMARCDKARIPFAPIARPEDMFEDPHLAATGGLMPTELPNGTQTNLPRLPLQLDGATLALRHQPPGPGAHTTEILREAGYSPSEIKALVDGGTVATH